MNSGTLRDDVWLWGHDAGAHHLPEFAGWKIPGTNTAGPVEGAAYLGIRNCCRVIFNGKPAPPFDSESEQLRGFRRVVWSVLGDRSSRRNDDGGDDLEPVLDQAGKYGNICGAVLDDLFDPDRKDARTTPERLAEMADKLHHSLRRPLELWIVYYAALFKIDYSRWLQIPDVITFWSWTSEELAAAAENLAKICLMTPGKKHYAGCYLYNYGDCRPLTDTEMQRQLDLYLELWLDRRIDGIVVCSNNLVGTGLKAPELLKQWLQIHGDDRRQA